MMRAALCIVSENSFDTADDHRYLQPYSGIPAGYTSHSTFPRHAIDSLEVFRCEQQCREEKRKRVKYSDGSSRLLY